VRKLALAAALALALVPAIARADGVPDDAAADAAEALGEQAYDALTDGKAREAIELYLRAYESAPAARFLLNVADIYRTRLHDREQAAAYYKRYAEAPDAEPALVRRALDALATPDTPSAPRAAPSPIAGPPDAVRATPTSDGVSLRTWGYVAGSVGLGALVVGTVLGLVAKSKNDEASRSCVGQACSDPRALTLTDQAAGLATAADVAFVAGGVLVAGGVTLVLVAPTPASPVRGFALSGVFR
jgi:tetratricopeptide (TPR) repeat protein